MITIYVDSFYTASEVHRFIQSSLNTYGYISLGDILCKAGYTHTDWTYDNIIFHKELNEQKMPIVPAYVDKSKPYTIAIPSDRYSMMFNCTNKNDLATKAGTLNTADKINIVGITDNARIRSRVIPKPTNYLPEIKNVKFNGPATIVFWADGTKTVVKCQDEDDYSEEVGLAMCIVKKAFGNTSKYNDIFKKWCPRYGTETNANDYLSEVCKQFGSHILKIFNEII